MKKFAGAVSTVALAIIGFCGQASAGDLYVLGSVGSTMASDNAKNNIQNAVAGTGVKASSLSNGTGFKLMLGYQFSETFAVEGGYIDMGKLSTTLSSGNQSLDISVKPTGLNLALVGMYPMTADFSLIGKVGFTSATAVSEASGFGSSSETKTSAGYGVGVGYKLTNTLSLRGEWERLYEDISMASISLKLNF